MEGNIITAVFCGTRFISTRPAWLIDYGMILKLDGIELPEVYEVDFANSKSETATRVLGGPNGVVIPDKYFLTKNAQQIFAWLYLHTGSEDGYTKIQVTIPLNQRPDVTDVPPTPEEQSIIEQAIVALNNGVERSEAAAENAEQSAQDAADAVEHVQETVDNALQEAKGSGEFDGVTYTPFVDADGVISWTNDGGLPDPQPRNIKGPQGDKLTYADLTASDKADLIQGPIAEAQAAAVAAVNQAGTTQISAVNQAGAAQVQAVEDKGEEVLESIPSDYTELSEDVDTLKSQINDKAAVIVDTASGAIASFPDGAADMPLKSLIVNIEPVQAGSGDPSPTNVRPISGRTSATIYHSGADTSEPTTYTIQLGDTVYGGTLDVTQGKMVVDRMMVDLGALAWVRLAIPLASDVYGFRTIGFQMKEAPPISMVKCSMYPYIGSYRLLANNDNACAYIYNTNIVIRDDTYTDVNDFKSAVTGQQLSYPLANPIEITLTPTQIDTLLGTNNIWADSGPVSVDYPADTKLYIQKINAPSDADMIADTQIASGKYFIKGNNLYLSTTIIPAGDTIIPGTNCTQTNLAEALNALNT